MGLGSRSMEVVEWGSALISTWDHGWSLLVRKEGEGKVRMFDVFRGQVRFILNGLFRGILFSGSSFVTHSGVDFGYIVEV
mmetsp:Transcript_1255/g.2651  ORF Transcript_1255/g.2651 Transcript_1255/m.2651 type:complete len:80 (-) Transcript_1255:1797-2036(-)